MVHTPDPSPRLDPRGLDDARPQPTKPLQVLVPRRRWLPADPRELWQFRALLARFAARDLTLRYRQTALGVVWVVLQPLLAAGILTFVFGSVASLPAPRHIPYFVFSLTGMVAWTVFNQIVSRASGSLVSNAQLVSKVFFPRLLIPLSSVLSTSVDVFVTLILLAILMVATGVTPGLAVLMLPVWLLLLTAVAVGVGTGAGAMMVRYRDVQYMLPFAVQFLLYASPVAYALGSVPHGARFVYELNPLTGLLEAVRWSVLNTAQPNPALLAYAIASSLVVLAAGVLYFSRVERQFADVI